MLKQFLFLLAFLLGLSQALLAQQANCQALFFVQPPAPGALVLEVFNFSQGANPQSIVYSWDFGDGQVSVSNDPFVYHTYAQVGTYNLCLTMTDTVTGCTSTYCETIFLQPANCTAHFSYSVGANEVTFFELTGLFDSLATFTWDFGDGSTGTGPQPSHTYAQVGATYNVCLTVDAPGCATQFCQVITPFFAQNCHAGFWSWPDSTHSLNLQFFNTSSATPNAVYTWDFGDGNVQTNNNPAFSYTFASSGAYDVCLTVNDGICSNQSCQRLEVGDPAFICDAWFSFQVNGNDLTVFEASQVQDSIITYDWTFGDGSTGTGPQFTHNYAQTGVYEVCLTVTTTFCAETSCQLIDLAQPNNCFAYFWTNPDTANTLTAQIFNGSIASPNATYTWDFGDGTTAVNNQPDFVHTYPAAGNYYACLTVNDGNCFNQYCTVVFAGNPALVCDAWFSISPNGNSVTVNELSNVTDPLTIYNWTFGDGNTGSGPQFVHPYAQPGIYEVCLTVTTPSCTGTYCQWVHLGQVNNNCVANYWAWPSANDAQTIEFTNASNGWPADFTWDFGDGTTLVNNQPTLSHTYATPGIYNICLTMSDSNCTNTYCSPLHVQPNGGGGGFPGCSAQFSYYNDPTSLYLDAVLVDPTLTYRWDFQTGEIFYGPTLTYPFAVPGLYWICLTVTNADGSCYDYFCQSVEILPQNACEAGLMVIPDTGAMQNLTYTFVNTSIGGDSSTVYALTLDNGQTFVLQGQSFTYTFPAPGIYPVCLSMQGNCTDVICFPLQVGAGQQACQASFFFLLDSIVFNPFNLTIIHNSIAGPGAQYTWDFGDGNTSNDPYPTHTYANFGVYTICLTLFDPTTGCSDILCDTIGVDSMGNIWRNGFTLSIQPGSPTSVEEVQPSLSPSLRLFPNPATTALNLGLTMPVQEECVLTVTSVTGQILLQQQVQLTAGEQQLSLPVGDLPAGVYAVQLQGGQVNLSELFVKQ